MHGIEKLFMCFYIFQSAFSVGQSALGHYKGKPLADKLQVLKGRDCVT